MVPQCRPIYRYTSKSYTVPMLNRPSLTIANPGRRHIFTVPHRPCIQVWWMGPSAMSGLGHGGCNRGKQQMEGVPPLDMGNFLNYCNQLPAQGPRSGANQEGHGQARTGQGRGEAAMATADGREVNWVVAARKRGDRHARRTIRSQQACCYRANLLAVDPQD